MHEYWHTEFKVIIKSETEIDHSSYTPIADADIEDVREFIKTNIKDKTGDLIVRGFTFNGELFGSHPIDQNNWNTLLGLKDVLTYPLVNIVKKYDGDYYTVTTKNDLESIVLTGMAHVNRHRADHKVLTDQAAAADNLTELETILNNNNIRT